MPRNDKSQISIREKLRRDMPQRWPGPIYWVILITSLVLMVALTISLFVALALEDNNTLGGYVGGGNGGGGASANGGNGGVSGGNNGGNATSGGKTKTGIMLPSATANGTFISSAGGDTVQIEGISSECAVLVNVGNNLSVAERNADTVIYPASMTKVMTLLVACENAKAPTAKLTVTQEMVDYQQKMGGSGNLGFKAGESVTVEDALYLINYRSDTIACLLVAEYIAQSEEGFVSLMNQKARQIGLTKTNFTNCTGLHNTNHYTTCREMAAIMKCTMNNNVAKKIITSFSGYTVDIYADGQKTRSPMIYSGWYSERMGDNPWVGGGADVKVLGGKTGYEDIPTSCFVTYAQNTETNAYYVCVTVGRITEEGAKINNSQSTTDTKTIYKNYAK